MSIIDMTDDAVKEMQSYLKPYTMQLINQVKLTCVRSRYGSFYFTPNILEHFVPGDRCSCRSYSKRTVPNMVTCYFFRRHWSFGMVTVTVFVPGYRVLPKIRVSYLDILKQSTISEFYNLL